MRPELRFRLPAAGLVLAGLIVLSVALAGCVSENRPSDCDEDAKTIRLTVDASSMEPNDPAACRDQEVTLIVDPEVDGILHVHGLDTILPATTITAGEELRLEFSAERTGQFPIELHPVDDPQGVSVGILTIHER
jgi:hypothetical protein